MGAAFLDVERCVTRLLRRGLAHENVDTQGWQSPLRRKFDHLLVGRKIFVSGVLDENILKADLLQNA